MVTIEQLKKQIERERERKRNLKTKIDLEVEKANLKLELKKLQRKPGTLRNIKIAKRTGRGLKLIGKKTFKVVKKQALLIKAQQDRDAALARKNAKKTKKKVKKVARQQSDFFGGLQEMGF